MRHNVQLEVNLKSNARHDGFVGWVAFPASGLIGGQPVGDFGNPTAVVFVLTVAGGFVVGYFSILANGCPFRQHVLAAQGTISSMTYLMGFFIGAFVFQLLVAPVIFEYLL
jgi:uncharacterized membrane protein YedE/YeeE